MQIPIIGTRGQAKPYASIPRINWGHPLARGLVSYGYDIGTGPIDLVTGAQRIIGNSTNPPFGGPKPSKYGSALTSITTSGVTLGLYNLPTSNDIANLTVAAPYSFAMGFMLTVAPTTLNQSTLYMTSDTASTLRCAISVGQGANLNNVAFNFGSSAIQPTAAGTLTINTFNTAIGVAIDGSNGRCYTNGALVLSPAVTTTAGAVTGIKPAFFGRPNFATQSLETGYIYFGALWKGRALTASEARLLHDDPYCFLIYPEDEMFASLVGATFQWYPMNDIGLPELPIIRPPLDIIGY